MQIDSDAFTSGQILSKLWLAENLERVVDHCNLDDDLKILAIGGWYGILHFILKARSKLKIKNYRSLDIDPGVGKIAESINETWVWQNWKFKSITDDANIFKYTSEDFNTVINTSVEHIESNQWFENIPEKSLVVLQSNNMPHDDHLHNHQTLEDFIKSFPLNDILYHGQKLFQYNDENFFKRFMIIGIK
jgi:hypothetical protein